MERRELHTLRFWRFVRIVANDISLRRFLANFSVCRELLDLFSLSAKQILSDKVRL